LGVEHPKIQVSWIISTLVTVTDFSCPPSSQGSQSWPGRNGLYGVDCSVPTTYVLHQIRLILVSVVFDKVDRLDTYRYYSIYIVCLLYRNEGIHRPIEHSKVLKEGSKGVGFHPKLT
jgi:hypothetical protein